MARSCVDKSVETVDKLRFCHLWKTPKMRQKTVKCGLFVKISVDLRCFIDRNDTQNLDNLTINKK